VAIEGEAPGVLTRSYYQRLYLLEEHHGWHRGMRAYTRALLGPVLEAGDIHDVLDVGCGTGGLLTWLCEMPEVRAVGLEYARAALSFCKQRGLHRLVESSATSLPFASASFDLLTCTDVLQHVSDPPGDTAALAEAWRVLRPGGRLFLRTNSACGGDAVRSSNYRRYLRSDLVDAVQHAGFAVERASYANVMPALPTIARRRAELTRHDNEGAHAHTVDPGLGLRVRTKAWQWVDSALAAVFTAEALVLRQLRIDWPVGDSIVVLARKSASEYKPN
jgi:ubiquinone/menaquinone biosynthesis C-methylase UbiE